MQPMINYSLLIKNIFMKSIFLVLFIQFSVIALHAQIGPHDYGPFSPNHFILYNYVGTDPYFKPRNIVSIEWDGTKWENKPDSFFITYNLQGLPLSLTSFEYFLDELIIGKELYSYNSNRLSIRSHLYYTDSNSTWDTTEVEIFNYNHKGNVDKWERQFYGDTTIYNKVVDSLSYAYDGDLMISYDRFLYNTSLGEYEPYERLEYKYDTLGALTDVYTMVYDHRINSFINKFHTRHFAWHNHRCRNINRELHPTNYTIYAWEDSVFVPFEEYVLKYDTMDNIIEHSLYEYFGIWNLKAITIYSNEYMFDTVLTQTTIESNSGQGFFRHKLVYNNQFQTGLSSNMSKLSKFGVYPNPTADIIHLPQNLIRQEYEVYNSLGKRMLSGTVSETATVSLTQLPPGTYFLRLLQTQQHAVVVKE